MKYMYKDDKTKIFSLEITIFKFAVNFQNFLKTFIRFYLNPLLQNM